MLPGVSCDFLIGDGHGRARRSVGHMQQSVVGGDETDMSRLSDDARSVGTG